MRYSIVRLIDILSATKCNISPELNAKYNLWHITFSARVKALSYSVRDNQVPSRCRTYNHLLIFRCVIRFNISLELHARYNWWANFLDTRAKSLSYSAKRLIFIPTFQSSMQILALEYSIINLIYENKMFSSDLCNLWFCLYNRCKRLYI